MSEVLQAPQTYNESFSQMKTALDELYEVVSRPPIGGEIVDFYNPNIEKQELETKKSAYIKVIKTARSLPEGHLLKIVNHAVEIRNSDEMDTYPQRIPSAEFNQKILMLLLSEDEQAQIMDS